MLQLKEEKHRLSTKYDFSTDDIDESIIPILVIVDNLLSELSTAQQLIQNKVGTIEKLLEQSKPPIYCDKPKTALLVGIGRYGSFALSISLFLSVFWIGLVMLKTNEKKYFHFEKLTSIIQFDKESGNYFIEKNHFKKVKNGIILKK